MSDERRLSKLLFEAREQLDMFADIMQSQIGQALGPRRVRDEIDAYRNERGWSPHGYGRENA